MSPTTFDAITTPLLLGTTLIEAGAGSGKTHAITRLVLRLLLEGIVPAVDHLLVVTFTKAATAELAGRIRKTLAEAVSVFSGGPGPEDLITLRERHGDEGLVILRDALGACDTLEVATLHGFCKRALDGAAFEAGMPFAPEFLTDDSSLVEEAVRDVIRSRTYDDPLTAAVALVRKWTIAGLADAHAVWARHHGATILPPPPDLDAALATVRATAVATKAAWDPIAVHDLLAGATWNDQAPLAGDGLDRALAALEGLDGSDLAAAFAAAAHFTPTALHTARNKRIHKQPPDHPALHACARLSDALAACDHAWRGWGIAEVDRRLEQAKRAAHQLAYDDLLLRLREALRAEGSGEALALTLADRYRAVLVDEFQDTDPIQCEILHRCFATGRLLLIGDPKQAIFAFRGADLAAYLDTAAAADQHHGLDRNWRSTATLVQGVNALFSGGSRPFLDRRVKFQAARAAGVAERAPLTGDEGPPLRWWRFEGDALGTTKEALEASAIAQCVAEAVRLLASPAKIGGRPIQPRDLAVLVRTNVQATDVRRAMLAAGIPAVTAGSGDVLASDEAAELQRILAAVITPGDGPGLRAALATGLWGLDALAIQALTSDEPGWNRLIEALEDWRDRWRRNGIGALVEEWLESGGWTARLLAGTGGERRITNLRHLRELLQEAEHEHHLAPTGLLAWMEQARARGGLERERIELHLESDADAAQVRTIHSAKGLEFPVVFCPFLWQQRGRRPVPATVHREHDVAIAWAGPEYDALAPLAEAEALAEDLRLAYVALTRAIHRCHVCWIDRSESRRSALGYLLFTAAPDDGSSDPDWLLARRAEADAAEAATALDRLVARGDGAIILADAPLPPPGRRWSGAAATAVLPAVRRHGLGGQRMTHGVTTSFTALTSAAETERDHRDAPSSPAHGPALGIHAFPAGARAGTALHAVLERQDFAAPADPGSIAVLLDRHGLPAQEETAVLISGLIDDLRLRPLPGLGTPLASLAPATLRAEWSFLLPLASVRPVNLAGVFARHGGARLRTYARHLERLDPRSVQGYLTGFVDLVVRAEDGRWWVLDWKSNRLGDHGEAYTADSLWAAMVEHQYPLQAHLYLLALRRQLRARGDDARLGGALYVFLRGLAGGEAFAVEPACEDLLDALDELLVAPAVEALP